MGATSGHVFLLHVTIGLFCSLGMVGEQEREQMGYDLKFMSKSLVICHQEEKQTGIFYLL